MSEYDFIDHDYDVIVVGAGGSGLRAHLVSLNRPKNRMHYKGFPTRSHTVAAQGGISAALEIWVKMIGVGICTILLKVHRFGDQDAIEYMCKEALMR